MTTLVAWVGVDQRGPASLRFAADSRITWPSGSWDYGRKLFASHTKPDMMGYAGDVLFPTQTLGQIIELIDNGLLFASNVAPDQRVATVVQILERAAAGYPRAEVRDFDVLYGTRVDEGMGCSFAVYNLHFARGVATRTEALEIPKASTEIVILGSGTLVFKDVSRRWHKSDVGGTSRAVFSALADSIKSGRDSRTGGPPQLVSLYRRGPATTLGVVWEGRRFLSGMEVANDTTYHRVKWHNELFEISDPVTLKRAAGSQPQPRPRGV